MPIKTIDLLHARASSFKAGLENADSQTKKRHVSKHLAESFNTLLDEIKKVVPSETAAHLPPSITFVSDAARVAGMSDVYYLDLEIMVDQVLRILEILKNER